MQWQCNAPVALYCYCHIPKYPSSNLIVLLASLPYLFIRPTKNSKEFAPFYISCCSQCYALLCFVLFQRLIDATYVCGRSELLISIEIGIMPQLFMVVSYGAYCSYVPIVTQFRLKCHPPFTPNSTLAHFVPPSCRGRETKARVLTPTTAQNKIQGPNYQK